MKNLHCPAYVAVLIHCHTSPEPLLDCPVRAQALQLFLKNGLVVARAVPPDQSPTYQTTALGAAYVDSLCLLPPPSVVYVDALGNQLPTRG